MRGIVITGGKAPDAEVVRLYASRCEWCVAADSGLDTALAACIIPDYVVGDMDSLSDRSKLGNFDADRVRISPREKDATDTDLALELLAEKGCDERVIIGGGGGRLDHLFALRRLFESETPPSMWISEESLVAGIGERFGFGAITLDGLGEEAPVSVFTCGKGPWRAKSSGLFWPIDSLKWASGEFSLSNKVSGSSSSIRAERGSFLVILPVSSHPVFVPY